jgi:hypothetical protein
MNLGKGLSGFFTENPICFRSLFGGSTKVKPMVGFQGLEGCFV